MGALTGAALAVVLHPHSPTHWVATYYPLVATAAGRWADTTRVLHECLVPTASAAARGPARWLEASSPDPHHPCYDGHRPWRASLAADYATALAIHDTEATHQPRSLQQLQRLRDSTVVIAPGQLSEWILHDLDDETSPAQG